MPVRGAMEEEVGRNRSRALEARRELEEGVDLPPMMMWSYSTILSVQKEQARRARRRRC
jgi:hypothetical protein